MRALLLIALLGLTSRAYAFSNAADFDRATVVEGDGRNGGGAGRHFTGAPGDGYPCSVCHMGSGRVNWSIEGLPEAFVRGASYDLELTWTVPPSTEAFVGVQLEIVNEDGTQAGEMTLGESSEALPDELCESTRRPTTLIPSENRQLLSVDACAGPTAARFSWTAPATSDVAVLYFGMVVRGDPPGRPTGDQATNRAIAIGAMGAPPPAIAAPQGCAAAAGRGGAMLLVLLTLALRKRC